MGLSRWEYWSGLLFPPPGDLPDPGVKPTPPVSPALADGFLTTKPPGEAWSHMMIYKGTCCDTLPVFGVRHLTLSLRHILQLKSAHPCKLCRFWLCDPVDCSPPGSSVHGIFQARTVECVAISSSRGLKRCTHFSRAFPGGAVVKNLPADSGDLRDEGSRDTSWVRKIPWRCKWQPTLVFLPGIFHGQRSLAFYSPRSHKESDMTKHAWTRFSLDEKEIYSSDLSLEEFFCLLLSHLSASLEIII